jgi:outer membrane lipoprotein-sorting protein
LKKILSLVLVVAMVLGCISLIACGGGVDEEAPPSEEEEEAPPSEEEEEPPPSGEDLSEILGQGTGITSVKYDMVVTAPGAPTMTMEMWVEGNKIRAEMDQQGQTIVMLIDYDEGVAYMYMPAENFAYEMPLGQAPESAVEQAQAVADYSPHIIGTETMDGKVCLVAEYTIGQASVKMWIWKEHGFPIRIESTAPEGKTVTEFQNIDFADIDDSKFELPAGVEIMEF